MANLLKKNWKQPKKKTPVAILSFNEHKQKQSRIKEEQKNKRSRLDELKQKKRAYNAELKQRRIVKETKDKEYK